MYLQTSASCFLKKRKFSEKRTEADTRTRARCTFPIPIPALHLLQSSSFEASKGASTLIILLITLDRPCPPPLERKTRTKATQSLIRPSSITRWCAQCLTVASIECRTQKSPPLPRPLHLAKTGSIVVRKRNQKTPTHTHLRHRS